MCGHYAVTSILPLQSGEREPLDLGLPISNLDGLRVVLDAADHSAVKGK